MLGLGVRLTYAKENQGFCCRTFPMSDPRPLDAAKIDRLKTRFEQVRAHEQGRAQDRQEPRARERPIERPITREASRTKSRERDQGLDD